MINFKEYDIYRTFFIGLFQIMSFKNVNITQLNLTHQIETFTSVCIHSQHVLSSKVRALLGHVGSFG